MKTFLNNAREEFKRCDHLLYVSLKYTRTVDVIKSLIGRMLSTYESALDYLFIKEKKKLKGKEIPSQVGLKIELARKVFADDPLIISNLDAFTFLRKVDKVVFKRESEYRRHVRLVAVVDGVNVTEGIDEMMVHFHRLKEFLEFLDDKDDE